MFLEERHMEILNLLNEKKRITIGEIQEKFDISSDSARRDLRILEEKGMLKRTHGGAIPLVQRGMKCPKGWNVTKIDNVFDNYDAIAKTAVKYIKPDDTIYITSGTVGYLMLRYLPRDFEFTVVTNSVDNAATLRDYDNVSVYVIGGKMRQNGRIVDSFAQESVRNMRLDVNFMTGAGITAEFGVSNGTPETVTFHRIIAENSRKNIALFPSNKIGHNSFLKDVDINKVDILITDWDANEDHLAKIEDLGVEVIIVQKD